MSRAPSFLCTFCWLPHHPPHRPRLLGAEARISCQACWEQLLDLAICWVCGEVVVRGDEVVSLGWCFWHRHCFGCLVCGYPLVVGDFEDDMEGSAEMGEEGEMGGGLATGRRGAVELKEVPVCAWCDDMLVGTGAFRDEVELFLGRRNVRWHDDGLSDARWERLKASEKEGGYDKHPMWQGSKARRSHRSSDRRSKSESGSFRTVTARTRRTGRRSASYSFESSRTTPRRDSSLECRPLRTSDSISEGPQTPDPALPPAQIYISIINPINGSSFRPSPTKPIPRWMSFGSDSRAQLPHASVSGTTGHPSRFCERGRKDFDDAGESVSPLHPMPVPSSLAEHSAPHTIPSPLSALTTVPESAETTEKTWGAGHRRSIGSESASASDVEVYGTPPEYPSCGYFWNGDVEDVGRRGGVGMAGDECELSAEYLERYGLNRVEKGQMERERERMERMKNVRGALERVRGKGSVRYVVERARRELLRGEVMGEKKNGEENGMSDENGRRERLRRELMGLFRSDED